MTSDKVSNRRFKLIMSRGSTAVLGCGIAALLFLAVNFLKITNNRERQRKTLVIESSVNKAHDAPVPSVSKSVDIFRLEVDKSAADILPWLQDQRAVTLSPDGREIIVKNELASGESEMRLEDLRTRKVIGSYRGGYPLLINWRPNSRTISFVKDESGDKRFRLYFWSPESNSISQPKVPVMSQAYRSMSWSPDGLYLGLRLPGNKEKVDELCIVDPEHPNADPVTVFEAESILDFAWSPDSKNIAIAPEGTEGDILITSPKTGSRKTVSVGKNIRINHLAWMYDGERVVTTCRDGGKGAFTTRIVKVATQESQVIAVPEGLIGGQNALPDGRVLFNFFAGGASNLLIAGNDTSIRPFGFADGITWKMAVENDGNVLLAHTGTTTPRGLYRVGLNGDKPPELIYRLDALDGFKGIAPTKLIVPISGGKNIVVLHWKTKRTASLGTLIKVPVDHSDLPSEAFNGVCQYIVDHGFDYVAFGFQSPDKNGTDEEKAVSDQDISDASEVIEYVLGKIAPHPKNVILFGESNATTSVIRICNRIKTKDCGVVLRGITKSIARLKPLSENKFRVALLQGENDPVPPLIAMSSVERVFGAGVLTKDYKRWWVLEHEGHTPRLLSSQSLVGAVLVETLKEQR